jgi:hypothetical protein
MWTVANRELFSFERPGTMNHECASINQNDVSNIKNQQLFHKQKIST